MSGRAKLFVILGFLVILAVIGVFAVNQTMARGVSMNDPGTVGNTPGNLYNGGYFCELDGVVYFSNPSDAGCLYSMKPDETGYKKLSSMSVRNILSAGRFLYMIMDSHSRSVSQGIGAVVSEYGIYRMRNDGRYTVCLLKEHIDNMQLSGNYLYFSQGDDTGGRLNRIRIDKKERTGYGNTPNFYDERINPISCENGIIYYSSVAGSHTLYMLALNREPVSAQPLYPVIVNQPIVQGSFVYFLDAVNGYRVARYNTLNGMTETLSSYGADCYNLNNTYIYYDSPTAPIPGLYRVNLVTGAEELLLAGTYNSLNLTSNYLYYRMYDADEVFYRLPINGPQVPGVFMPETFSD